MAGVDTFTGTDSGRENSRHDTRSVSTFQICFLLSNATTVHYHGTSNQQDTCLLEYYSVLVLVIRSTTSNSTKGLTVGARVVSWDPMVHRIGGFLQRSMLDRGRTISASCASISRWDMKQLEMNSVHSTIPENGGRPIFIPIHHLNPQAYPSGAQGLCFSPLIGAASVSPSGAIQRCR